MKLKSIFKINNSLLWVGLDLIEMFLAAFIAFTIIEN